MQSETDGYSCLQICSDQQTLQWEDSSFKIRVMFNHLVDSVIFLQEVAGIEDKLSDTALCTVSLKELMAQASPARQAPRFPTILLSALEDTVLSFGTPLFLRVLSWWLLVQSWRTLRFDDHLGLLPRDFKVSEAGLLAKLTRSRFRDLISGSMSVLLSSTRRLMYSFEFRANR